MPNRTNAAPESLNAPDLPAAAPVGRLALALARMARENMAREGGTDGPLVHVAESGRRADALAACVAALAPDLPMARLPAWDCFPYDRMPPSQACMGARMSVLRRLAEGGLAEGGADAPALVLTTPAALLRRVPPRTVWAQGRLAFRVGEAFDPPAVEAALVRLGYRHDERADEPGEAAMRPHVLDVFPASADRPVRIEHTDGRVAAIHDVDPATSATTADRDALDLDPASEIVRMPDAEATPLPQGAEHRLAERYEGLETLFDYAPRARLVLDPDAAEIANDVLRDVADAHAAAVALASAEETRRPPLPPDTLHLGNEEWEAALARRLVATVPHADENEASGVPRFVLQERPRRAFARFVRSHREAGRRVVLCADASTSPLFLRRAHAALGERPDRIGSFDEVAKAEAGALLALAVPLEAGFVDRASDAVLVAAADLLGEVGRADTGPASPMDDPSLPSVGDVVVHAEHGIGRLEGLERVATHEADAEEAGEAVRLAYADGATLLVPVEELDRVWRHGGADDRVTLDRLDTDTWAKRRAGIEAAIAETARDLARLAAERAAAKAPALQAAERDLARFAARFPHPPTADQASAIAAVTADLARETPMDRLVCGDVGYGKTEVALRAAAIAAFAGKQVALVAPTTVLARQHAQTMHARFSGFGIETAQLSRLVSAAEAARVREGLADGSIRIVVGTHALAGEDVRFADLGLVIVDEEQRFGAEDKEALRRLEAGVHVLTLTATPIPATLAGSLAGLRDLSTIATPPVMRKPVRTARAEWDDGLVREALARERERGGQSFVVVPRIADIAAIEERLRALVPDLRVAVAHGRMKPAAIDEAMVGFASGEDPPDVLLATDIVESGLDVPRANTMLIVHPDRFGLAQLHQLRGRVGRGARQAHCWLLTEPGAELADATSERLDALVAHDRLGSGFALSLRDLDLRGAGALLGETQAGHVAEIGIGLHRDLVARALAAQHEDEPERRRVQAVTRLALGVAGAIPEAEIASPDMRLELYARLARLESEEALDALCDEIEDRFGIAADALGPVVTLARLRLRAGALGVLRLEAGPAALAVTLHEDVARRLAKKRLAEPASLDGNRLIYARETDDAAARLALAEKLIDALETLLEG
ncbi:DEAD/DEAH box helicase [Salinarimonas ramus]|uniref:Transcription-repair-coupling factor n=1 Tax=Salinarimonas ramus TaxID=690164 RepID=A0A917QIC7_9HYPH|nr:DEAD/DEAH box helicase [Salinarimonas ramus]GGK52033.1 transcription-repair-coupling factor [Salinarimonas ramus]